MEELLKLRKFIRIISHKPGKIKFKIAIGAITALGKFDTTKLKTDFKNIRGIESVDFSKLLFTCTIDYNADIIDYDDWHTILNADTSVAQQIILKYKL